jgi:hypothetical protein
MRHPAREGRFRRRPKRGGIGSRPAALCRGGRWAWVGGEGYVFTDVLSADAALSPVYAKAGVSGSSASRVRRDATGRAPGLWRRPRPSRRKPGPCERTLRRLGSETILTAGARGQGSRAPRGRSGSGPLKAVQSPYPYPSLRPLVPSRPVRRLAQDRARTSRSPRSFEDADTSIIASGRKRPRGRRRLPSPTRALCPSSIGRAHEAQRIGAEGRSREIT